MRISPINCQPDNNCATAFKANLWVDKSVEKVIAPNKDNFVKAAKVFETQVVSEQTAKTITDLLVESVNNGKSNIKLEKFNVAAKTGTSSKSVENGVGYTNFSYTSTVGYFPAEDPKVIIYVMVDSARVGAVWGNTVAAPVWREVALQCARILNLKPDKIKK